MVAESGTVRHIGLIGETAADARDVMVECEESGLLRISPPHSRPNYEPSKRRLTWPNGVTATTYSAEDPEQLRSPQFGFVWADEIGKWQYASETWSNMEFGLRIGPNPRVIATTTPRPIKLIRDLIDDPDTIVTTGTTYENRANLAPKFLKTVIKKYEGTRLGRQELEGQLLTDVPGALWTRGLIEANRVTSHPDLKRVVVAVDPEATSNEESSETGIIVCGIGVDDIGYVLADVTRRDTPAGWGSAAVAAYNSHDADRIVAEVNNGGEMVEFVIKTVDPKAAYKAVRASRGKQTRAEPVAALQEQGRIKYVGPFDELEDQLCGWVPGMKSPDRLDALVWGFTELMLEDGARELNIR